MHFTKKNNSITMHHKVLYLALCLTGGDGGCLACRGHMSDRQSSDPSAKVSVQGFPFIPMAFESSLLLRMDFEDLPNPVDTVAMVPVPLSIDCSATCYSVCHSEE